MSETDICPVCGDEFVIGWDDVSEGQSIDDIRICVVEKDGDGRLDHGVIHFPEGVGEDDE